MNQPITTKTQSILFDHGRHERIGLPEAVFCEGKDPAALLTLLTAHGQHGEKPILFTRLAADVFNNMPSDVQSQYNYHALSRTAYSRCLPVKAVGTVAVVSAGTADGCVTWEAARTLEYLGIHVQVYEDNGVAGLWRLTSALEQINQADAVIVIAGLDAALASVMGGLTGKPLFAVPTSVGYGVARKGETALMSMLVSCAQGVGVMNIDNGFGAACAAARVINLLNQQRK